MDFLLGIVSNLGMLIPLGAFIYWVNLVKKKRIEGFRATAEEMGLQFTEHPDAAYLRRYDQFRLFQRGNRRRINNLIEGDSGAVELQVFDYCYTISRGKKRKSRKQTVASLKSPQLNMPSFSIRPENVLSRIGSAMGMQDIDFDSHPKFSKMFEVTGEDEQAIRNFLKPSVLDYFENHPRISLEASGDTLFFYVPRRRVEPDEIKDLLSQAYEAYGVLTAEAEAECMLV